MADKQHDTDQRNEQEMSPIHDPVFHASPGHLRAAAHLYGFKTAPLDTARVLELGCGSGRNLYAFALAHPQAQVVGVDLWVDALEKGQLEAQELGIQNLRLVPALFTDIDQSFGEFDYIIVRDEFTWAPDVMREAVLRICQQNLSANGVACVGYHVYPGWRAGDTLRDAIQLHAHSATSLEQIRANAGAMLGLMADGMPAGTEGADQLRSAAQRLLLHPEYYISADFLERQSNATYLLDMVGNASQLGLTYVGDAQPDSEQSSSYGTRVNFQHSLVSLGQGAAVKQQYLDFAVNRGFRRSLFVHADRVVDSLPGMDRKRLTDLHFACGLKRKFSPTLPSLLETEYINPGQRVYRFKDAMTLAVCDVLGSVWPHTLQFDALLAATTLHVLPGSPETERREALLLALEALMVTGELKYRLEPGPYNGQDTDGLEMLPFLANKDIAEDGGQLRLQVLFNLWNDAQQVTVERSPAAMRRIFRALENGENTLLGLHPELVDFVENLKWHGLVIGSEYAWLQYYAMVLSASEKDDPRRKQHLLISYVGHYRNAQTEPVNGKSLPSRFAVRTPIPAERINLVEKLRVQKKYDNLEELAQEFIKKYPSNYYGWYALALAHQGREQQAEAEQAMYQALSMRPQDPQLYLGLVSILPPVKGAVMQLRILGMMLWNKPDYSTGLVLLGNIYRENEDKPKAIRSYEHALKIAPNTISAEKNIAILQGELGNLQASIDLSRKVLEKEPSDQHMFSNYLYALSQYDGVSPEEMFQEHRKFGRLVERMAKKTGQVFLHGNVKDAGRKLRVGFVSGDFRNHAVARFIEPVWRKLDRSSFSIHAYSTNVIEDMSTQTLKKMTDSWSLVTAMSDLQLANQIYQDKIDILFDLSGHTGYNRLSMFAYKPAPLQISWIGYPGTTGIAAMDYYIANKFIVPEDMPEIEGLFTEKLIRMVSSASFEYPNPNPEPNKLPALEKGYFTFGSFNRISKVNHEVFKAWADILHAVPGSKFLMGHVEGESFKPVVNLFASLGIPEDRLILKPRTVMDKYLTLHHDVDLILDTFPYNGGTTTFYGLWMGVPTLTFAGKSVPSRVGAAILGPLGLEEFIVNSRDEYISHAIRWSSDLDRLAALRGSTRQLFTQSVVDADAMANSLGVALRQVWVNWCEGNSPRNFSFD